MKRALGLACLVAFVLAVWSVGPLVAIAANAIFRPGYEVRDLASEYRARQLPNRVRWYDLRTYRMDCPPNDERRVVILHTAEFAETPSDFLSRRFPGCSGFVREESEVPGIFSGLLVGRW